MVLTDSRFLVFAGLLAKLEPCWTALIPSRPDLARPRPLIGDDNCSVIVVCLFVCPCVSEFTREVLAGGFLLQDCDNDNDNDSLTNEAASTKAGEITLIEDLIGLLL